MTIDLQGQPSADGSVAASFTPPPITHLSHVAYLVGTPIAHSSSPKLHDTISHSIDTPYAQILAETTQLASFMSYIRNHPALPTLLGSGVTMPHKVAVLPYLDYLTPEAQAIGAVNTIFLREKAGKVEYWGTNTDTIGIRDAFVNNLGAEVLEGCKGRPGVIVGGGGTCRAAVYALENFLRCSEIYILNRDPEEVRAVTEQHQGVTKGEEHIVIRHITSLDQVEDDALEPPGLVISAIPDYPPTTPSEMAVRDILEALLLKAPPKERGALMEMCYHPSPDTGITRLAEQSGWKVIGGLEAMIAQGLEQARLWLGKEVDQVEDLRERARQGVKPR